MHNRSWISSTESTVRVPALPSGRRVAIGSIVAAILCGTLIGAGPLGLSPLASAQVVLGIILIPVALVRPEIFACGALLLISSDRFLAVEIFGLTLKPSHLLFGYAVIGIASASAFRRQAVLANVPRGFIVAVAGLLILHVLASLVSARPDAGARAFLVVLGGSIIPSIAILGVIQSRERALLLIRFFVLGQLIVAVYGIYQFIATFLGLPLLVSFFGTVVAGGHELHRVSALSYEPAFYAAYAVTGLPLILSDAVLHRRRFRNPLLSPGAIALVVTLALLLTNSRAGLLACVVIIVGVWIGHRKWLPRREGTRSILLPVLAVTAVLGMAAVAVRFDLVAFARDRVVSIVNEQEGSNAVRLTLYKSVLRIIEDNPLMGVGPRQLGYELQERREYYFVGPPEQAATANNIWLQGAVETGLLSIPLMAGVLWMNARLVRRRASFDGQLLALGAFVFLLVSGMFVSFFWDVKYWAVIALAIGAHAHLLNAGERKGYTGKPSLSDGEVRGSLVSVRAGS